MIPRDMIGRCRPLDQTRPRRGRPQAFGLTHEYCPRNTLGASRKNARETVTVVRHGEWVIDDCRTLLGAPAGAQLRADVDTGKRLNSFRRFRKQDKMANAEVALRVECPVRECKAAVGEKCSTAKVWDYHIARLAKALRGEKK